MLLICTIILYAQPQRVVSQQSELVYSAEPDQLVDIRMELYNESQTFTGITVNVTIYNPNTLAIESFNHTVTSVSHVWFGWKVPYNAPLGNYSVIAYDYYTLLNTTARVVVDIPYVIVITGFVINSYGSTYPSYPVTFINFNRTNTVVGQTDKDGFYSVVLSNTTIGNVIYGIAKMVAEESSVTLTVTGNFTQSFHTQQVNVAGGGGGGSGSGREGSVTQRDGIFYGAIAMAFISLGTASAVLVKMARK